jgi:hypothetical protein
MKRKLFTLLLASVALMAFQANAQEQRSWILADTSGLAKNALYSDSFPNAKLGLYNWLSDNGTTFYVHSRVDTTSRYEIYEDDQNKFQLEKVGGTNEYRFYIKKETVLGKSFELDWDKKPISQFEIVQFNGNKREAQKFVNDTIEGYLALPQGETLGPDSAELVLAGANKKGEISFKKFSEFGAHAPKAPASPLAAYQFKGDPKGDTVPGRLYQSDKGNFFQTYFVNPAGPDSAIIADGSEPINWGSEKDPVYTYIDLALNVVKDTAKIALNDTIVRLDTIVDYLKRTMGTIGIDTFRAIKENRLYFTLQEGKLSFTAPIANTIDAKTILWTNGKPGEYKYKEEKNLVYYGINTDSTSVFEAFMKVMIDLFHIDKDVFDPNINQIERYLDKTEGEWNPLYIKVVPSCNPQPYEYVDSEWLKEGNYDLGAATQLTADAKGNTNGAVSIDGETNNAIIVEKDDPNRAKFFFEFADSISSVTHKLTGGPDVVFDNTKTIELFYIKNGDKYLTVLDTTIFSDLTLTDSVFTNTQLGWETKFKTVDRYRQAFAIVYNKDKDSIITLLPVASHKWKPIEGVSSYGKNLYYNQAIGAETPNSCGVDFVDLSKVWYITQLSKTGANEPQRLILVDPTSTGTPNLGTPNSGTPNLNNETIWFKTEVRLNTWQGPPCKESKVFAIYNEDWDKHYSVGGIFSNPDRNKVWNVPADSIRSHWYIKNIAAPGEIGKWVFAPEINTTYLDRGTLLTDTFIALDEKGDGGVIELININATSERTKIHVRCLIDGFSPFGNLDKLVGASKKIAILESLYQDRNIAYEGTKASLKQVEKGDKGSYSWVTVYKSFEDTLGTDAHIVPYYVFSYTDGDKRYFLNAGEGNDSVRWTSLSSAAEETKMLDTKNRTDYMEYKFCLPYFDGKDYNNADTTVYLQTAKAIPYLVKSGDETGSVSSIKFDEATVNNYKPAEGLYSAIDQYQGKKIIPISRWILVSEDGVGSDWVRVDDAVYDEDSTSVGVLTNVDYLGPGAAFLAPSSKTKDGTATGAANYGVLTDAKERGADFILEYKGAAQIGFAQDSIWYYNIYTIVEGDSLYLTDAVDSISRTIPIKYEYIYPNEGGTPFTYGYFTPTKLTEHKAYKEKVYADKNFRQTFGLKYTEPVDERVGFYFVIVSTADYTKKENNYRYLGRAGNRLVFVSGEESALHFQWGKVADDGYVGIKEVGAPAKIYGVAGGVKVANVSGAVSIYTIDGRLVTSKVAVSADQTIAVPAGIYIVKSGADVAKVVVR